MLYFRLDWNSWQRKKLDNTDRHRRKFPSRIRPGVRWPMCPRTWRCWWCSGARRSGPCSPASTRRGTANGRASPRPARGACRFAIAPRMNCHCNVQITYINGNYM